MKKPSKYKNNFVYFSYGLNRALSQDEISNRKLNMMGDVVIRFDSKLEFKVFQVLRNSSMVSSVIPHYRLEIVPKGISKVFPNGKSWKVDFLVKGHHKKVLCLIEAKGIVNREFPFILFLLEQYKPELFSKLWIVFDKVPTSSLLVKNLRKNENLKSPRLLSLSQFIQKFSHHD